MHFIILIGIFVVGLQTKNIFDPIVSNIIKMECPFRDMKGLSKYCTKEVSNSSEKIVVKLGTGWDPVKGEIKLPFFELTYTQNKVHIYNGTKYQIPDQVTFSPGNISLDTITKFIYTNVDQYLSKMNPSRTNISSGTLSLPIDAVSDFFHFFDTGNSNIVSVIENVVAYNMFFPNVNQLKINSFVQSAIDSLPEIYDASIYGMFLDYWGTQIVIGGIAGGMAEQTVMIKSCFGGIDAGSQAALYMLKTFDPAQYSNVNFAAGFQQYSRASIINIFGGDPKYVNPADWKLRMATMEAFPVLTSVETKPITDFILNQTIKANMQKAIDNYYSEGNQNLNSYRQAYLNSLDQIRTVTYVGVGEPENVVISTQTMAPGVGSAIPIPKSAYSSWTPTSDFEGFGCMRSGASTVRSYVDVAYMNSVMARENPYGFGNAKWTGTLFTGSDVAFGCSVSSYDLDLGRLNSIQFPGKPAHMNGYCCLNCIPDIRCDTHCHLYGCTCPSF